MDFLADLWAGFVEGFSAFGLGTIIFVFLVLVVLAWLGASPTGTASRIPIQRNDVLGR